MSISMKEHMIIPEVLADMVAGAFGSRLTLKPLAEEDNTLQGKPGDTLKFPAFRYIGKAARVDENGEVLPGLLSADTVSVSVRKFAKAVCITDEARLSGMGDPVGEAARQLAHAIDHAVDDELYEALKGVGLSRKAAIIDGLTANAVADALALFGEEQDGSKVLLTDAAGFAALRKDPAYLRAGDMAQEAIFKGVVGEIWGCQVVVSNRIQDDPALGEKQHFIVKPGALKLVSKTGAVVEVKREPEYMRDTVFASRHCAAYLYDAGRVVSLTQFTALQRLSAGSGIACTAGSAAGMMRIVIPEGMAPPAGYGWQVVVDDSPQGAGAFGTALLGGTDWPGSNADIDPGTGMYAHVLLVNLKDDKPVKEITLSVVTA